jgi:hypothetical protein
MRLLDSLESELATMLTLCDADVAAVESNAPHAVLARERVQALFERLQAVSADFAAMDYGSGNSGNGGGDDAASVLNEAKARADVPAAQIARLKRQLHAIVLPGVSAAAGQPNSGWP